MPKSYWFHCSECDFETFRYRNFTVCPECSADVIREEPVLSTCACFLCGAEASLEMYAHRDDRGSIVGWLFACRKCAPEISDSEIDIQLRIPQVEVGWKPGWHI